MFCQRSADIPDSRKAGWLGRAVRNPFLTVSDLVPAFDIVRSARYKVVKKGFPPAIYLLQEIFGIIPAIPRLPARGTR
jgi:hypothetical protein